jgi:hypothetical protein
MCGPGEAAGGQAHRRPDHLGRGRDIDMLPRWPRPRLLPARGDGRRGSAVHPLHLGLDRQAEGGGAHLGRLSGLCRDDASVRLRLPRRRRLLVHRRCRLGHRAQLHRLRPAGQRRHDADVRGRADLARCRPVLGGLRQAQGQPVLHRADRDPRADGQGRNGWKSTTCRPALLGTVGEPINPEAWNWYNTHVGKGKCPIVDTWWQTETGGHPDHAAARRDPDQARLGHEALLRRAAGGAGPDHDGRGDRERPRPRACCASPTAGPGRCAPSGAITSASSRPISSSTRATTSPATAAGATRTAITGSPAGSTT